MSDEEKDTLYVGFLHHWLLHGRGYWHCIKCGKISSEIKPREKFGCKA